MSNSDTEKQAVETADRSIGLSDLAQSVGVAVGTSALTTGLLQFLYLLQNPNSISFEPAFWVTALKTWMAATASSTATYLVGQNFGFKKGFVIPPPRSAGTRTRASDMRSRAEDQPARAPQPQPPQALPPPPSEEPQP